jgi:hypothetical protein
MPEAFSAVTRITLTDYLQEAYNMQLSIRARFSYLGPSKRPPRQVESFYSRLMSLPPEIRASCIPKEEYIADFFTKKEVDDLEICALKNEPRIRAFKINAIANTLDKKNENDLLIKHSLFNNRSYAAAS